ncbi:MAG TPA: hypothetical protein DEO38_03670 [Bacteroidales bacterium]|nr:hypothetical protein [Bacteroidales bacterium]
MPYRRLPKTDSTRVMALKKALQKIDEEGFNNNFITFGTINQARPFLAQFEQQLMLYQEQVEKKINHNREYMHYVRNARMYLSHFLQVFNLAVIRGEIKPEARTYFQLDPNTTTLPDLNTEESLILWGERIIAGDADRVRAGGMPIYNPTMAKVRVHYEIFKDHYSDQQLRKKITNRNWTELDSMRNKADAIILDIWNQVEEHFKDLKPFARLTACESYGLIYYYRNGEEPITAETDELLQRIEDASPKLPFDDFDDKK